MVDRAVARRAARSFPFGTLTVNISGAVLLGFITGLALPHEVALLAGTAFVGAYTTFSTWMLETQRLTEERQIVSQWPTSSSASRWAWLQQRQECGLERGCERELSEVDRLLRRAPAHGRAFPGRSAARALRSGTRGDQHDAARHRQLRPTAPIAHRLVADPVRGPAGRRRGRRRRGEDRRPGRRGRRSHSPRSDHPGTGPSDRW